MKITAATSLELARALAVIDGFGQMSRSEFLGQPKITPNSNAKDLRPKAISSQASAPLEPFLVGRTSGRLGARFTADGCSVHDLDCDEKVIACYYDFGHGSTTLVVDKSYRRQGIASEMVFAWRMRFPSSGVASTRTMSAQALQEQVWVRVSAELAKARVTIAIATQIGTPLKPRA